MPLALSVAIAFTGITLLVPGASLARRRGTRVSGAAMVCAGVLAAASPVVHDRWGQHMFSVLLAIAAGFLGVAAMAYPRPSWRDAPSWLAFAVMIVAPLGIGATAPQPWHSNGSGVVAMIALPPLLQLWWRVETAAPDERRTIMWFLLPALVGLLFGAAVAFFWGDAGSTLAGVLAALGLAGIGPSAWLGVARPSAIDVRGVVATTTVHVVAFIAVFTLFLTIVSALDAFGTADLTARADAFIAALCALVFEPTRKYLRLVADEILFGIRPDPIVAASQVALTAGEDPASALDSIRSALVLPYVALRSEGLPLIESGTPSDYRKQVGVLQVGLRPGDLSLSGNDEKVLRLAGPLLAQTARLQSARQEATSAREEERRRLRRDLHDGLGPRLSGIAFTADAARLSVDDSDALDVHLQRVRAESVAAIKEIRELVYGLRPPALDEVGLVEAIRLQTASLRAADGRAMRVELSAGDLPRLTAAVEVAAYRIVVEALTNAARHSGADHVAAELCVDGAGLRIVVRDSGMTDGRWIVGVGMSSMRERAAEIGGAFIARGGPEGGLVEATLPL